MKTVLLFVAAFVLSVELSTALASKPTESEKYPDGFYGIPWGASVDSVMSLVKEKYGVELRQQYNSATNKYDGDLLYTNLLSTQTGVHYHDTTGKIEGELIEQLQYVVGKHGLCYASVLMGLLGNRTEAKFKALS